LAFINGYGNHRSGKRGGYAGIAQVFRVGVHRKLRLANLRLKLRNVGLGKRGRCFRTFKVFGRGGVAGQQGFCSAVLAFGGFQADFFRYELRLIGAQLGFVCFKLVPLFGGVDFGNRLALGHRLPHLHIYFGDLAGNLRPNRDKVGRLHLASGDDILLQWLPACNIAKIYNV